LPDGPSQVLERIGRVWAAQQAADAELAMLIEHAVSLGIGWPDIASRLGVSRQAAREHDQRRHRAAANHAGQPA
jgi:hypothetical protein